MPRKRLVPTKKEVQLIRKAYEHLDFLIVKQYLFGVFSSITERTLKDLYKAIEQIIPAPIERQANRYYPEDFNFSKEFFERLDGLLKKLEESKSPALRTLNWRAKKVRPLLQGFPERVVPKPEYL